MAVRFSKLLRSLLSSSMPSFSVNAESLINCGRYSASDCIGCLALTSSKLEYGKVNAFFNDARYNQAARAG
ncbi:hypothetical protein D3C81_2287840 [compost metagenome]